MNRPGSLALDAADRKQGVKGNGNMDNRIESILNEALQKYQRGEAKYGPYKPETDPRDLLHEAEEEILDAINYLAMHLVRIRTVRKTPE